MADNVVALPQKAAEPAKPLVWTCGDCGGTSFCLYSDDTMRCVSCQKEGCAGPEGWRRLLPATPEEPETLQYLNDIAQKPTELIHRQFAEEIRKGEHAGAFIVRLDGGVRMWAAGATHLGPTKAWQLFYQALASIAQFVLSQAPPPKELN